MRDKKETAVEWLVQRLIDRQNGVINSATCLSLDQIFDHAKEMESKKQQKYDEMLGMLEKIIKENETDTRSWATFLEIKQLIKEAKEL
jgi:hypothetical protein